MGRVGKEGSTVRFLSAHFTGFDKLVTILVVFSILMVVPQVATPIVGQILVDDVLSGINPRWATSLIVFAACFAIIEIALRAVECMTWRLRLNMTVSSTCEMFWHALRLPVGWFHDKYAGDIASRIYYGKTITKGFDRLGDIVGDALLIVFYLYFMIRYSAVLSIFAIVHILLNYIIVRMVHSTQTKLVLESQKECDSMQGFTSSVIDNMDAIKGATAEHAFFQKWSDRFAVMQDAAIQAVYKNERIEAIPLLFGAVSNVLVLGIGSYFIIQGYLTVGMLMAFQGFMASIMTPVNHFMECGQITASIKAKAGRMEEVLSEPCDVPDELGSLDGIIEGKLRGEVELRKVTFGYDKSLPPVIKDFSLHLMPGKSVAFVGPSGCGKSTIAKLISGLYQPWSGEVLFDGKPQSEISRDVFANSVSVVDQNIVLFEGTIAENVKLWDDSVEDFAMVFACHDAQIHNEIAVRQGNYQARIESGGKNFSGGQRQRLELATSFAKEPSIMIMDEGTSALDTATEEKVMNSIRNMGCSQIIIAHRLSTIRDCDEIIVIDDGIVRERGTHGELMKNRGYYSRLLEI